MRVILSGKSNSGRSTGNPKTAAASESRENAPEGHGGGHAKGGDHR
jgi:hypothetical protein